MGKILGVIFMAVIFFATDARAEFQNNVRVRYEQDQEIKDFQWRMTGNKNATLEEATEILRDITARVQNRLGMIVPGVDFEVVVTQGLEQESQRIAYYNSIDRKIYVDSQRITPGVLAHEMAHAVMHAWEGKRIPHAAQEILAREVESRMDEV